MGDSHTFAFSLGNFDPEAFSSVRLLGRGGFGAVEEVLYRPTQQRFARKTLGYSHLSRTDIVNEIKSLQRLQHHHVIQFIGAYTAPRSVSLLLYPVAHSTLADYLGKPSPATSAQCTHVWRQFGCIVSALQHIHSGANLGMGAAAHCDIKPSNILIFEGKMLLSDFGASRFLDNSHPSTAASLRATPRYSAPELGSPSGVTTSVDIWSLGCVLMEAMTWILGLETEYKALQDTHFEQDRSYGKNVTQVLHWLTKLTSIASKCDIPKLEMIKRMINSNPSKRPKASEVGRVLTPGPCCRTFQVQRQLHPPSENIIASHGHPRRRPWVPEDQDLLQLAQSRKPQTGSASRNICGLGHPTNVGKGSTRSWDPH